jgi:hypothetical protein
MRFSSIQRLTSGDDDKVITKRLRLPDFNLPRSILPLPPIFLGPDLDTPLSVRHARPIPNLVPRIRLIKPNIDLTVLDKRRIIGIPYKLGPFGLSEGGIGLRETGEESVSDVVAGRVVVECWPGGSACSVVEVMMRVVRICSFGTGFSSFLEVRSGGG